MINNKISNKILANYNKEEQRSFDYGTKNSICLILSLILTSLSTTLGILFSPVLIYVAINYWKSITRSERIYNHYVKQRFLEIQQG